MADKGPPTINIQPPPSGGGGDGSSGGGGSSSSGGSSTPAAPPADQYVTDTYKSDAVKRQKEQTFAQIYMQLWGEPATENYLMKAVNEGLNSWEFSARERGKPEWAHTKAYKDGAHSLAGLLANLGVA